MSYVTLQDYWVSLKRVLPLVLLVSVVAAGIALVVVRRLPPGHQAHFSYLVRLDTREQSGEYQFDGFYALQAVDSYTTTLAGWLQTPETVAAAYRAAELELPTQDPRRLVRKIEARKVAPQLVEVTVRESDPARAGKLIEGLKTTLATHVAQYHADSIPGVAFGIIATEPWHGQRALALPVIVGATFVGTFFILLNGWLLFVAFAPAATSPRSSV